VFSIGARDFELGPRPRPRPDHDSAKTHANVYGFDEPLISSSGFAALAVISFTPCFSPFY